MHISLFKYRYFQYFSYYTNADNVVVPRAENARSNNDEADRPSSSIPIEIFQLE